MALADAARAAGARGRATRGAEDGPEGRASPCAASPPPDWRSWPAAPSSFSPGFSAGARDGWGDAAEHPAWQLEAGYDAAIGTLAHAWLERIGRDGIAAWPATALASRLSAMRRQLTRAGIPPARPTRPPKPCWKRCRPPCPTRAANGCCPNPARREWPLIDAAGKVSVIDLALSTEDGWLIVDYKTGRSQPGESAEAFAARMRQRHGEQLRRYCAQVTALDGRPTRAALYFPGARG